MNRLLHFLIFAAGLAAACWIGAHYLATNPLALAVTALIVVVYLAGAAELFRYQQATTSLARALTDLSEVPHSLSEWLDTVPSALRSEEHTSELQSLMRSAYAVVCWQKKTKKLTTTPRINTTASHTSI